MKLLKGKKQLHRTARGRKERPMYLSMDVRTAGARKHETRS